ncbi:MAG TPA: pseudouridine synthase [Kiritimatiellia bacterium]|nr:pseudouridine synthase [Kiritimatiellia bacterium]HMP34305.1 pseudouridine synthase [Kiritimatiellia bacterium]
MPVRLHKYLASCGVASRRRCEQLMTEGRVEVDGVIVREPGAQVEPERQEIRCNGRIVRPERNVYIALHKPPGHVCSSRDPDGRPLVIDLVPAELGRLYTIGRLDTNSEGLILLTNDGDFAHRLSHPRHNIRKVYEIWLDAPLQEADRSRWLAGIEDDGELLRVLDLAPLPGRSGAGHGYRVVLGEGRNRHLRRMATASGRTTLRLMRVAIGDLVIGPMKRASWRHLDPEEVAALAGRVAPDPRSDCPPNRPPRQKPVPPRRGR